MQPPNLNYTQILALYKGLKTISSNKWLELMKKRLIIILSVSASGCFSERIAVYTCTC